MASRKAPVFFVSYYTAVIDRAHYKNNMNDYAITASEGSCLSRLPGAWTLEIRRGSRASNTCTKASFRRKPFCEMWIWHSKADSEVLARVLE